MNEKLPVRVKVIGILTSKINGKNSVGTGLESTKYDFIVMT